MFKTIIHRIQKLLSIAKTYDEDLAALASEMQQSISKIEHNRDIAILKSEIREYVSRIKYSEDLIRERTDIAVDISPSRHDPTYVVLIGRYKNRDYVQAFAIRNDDLSNLIEQFKCMETYGELRKCDSPPAFRAVLENEFPSLRRPKSRFDF